jgi:hypothetical protein
VLGAGSHALLTRPPLGPHPKVRPPFDLHVLGAPPAFVLSQDQTLSFSPRPPIPRGDGHPAPNGITAQGRPKGVAPQRRSPPWAAQRRPVRMPQTCWPSPPMRLGHLLAPKTARTRTGPPAAASAPPPSAEMPEPKATLKPPPTHPFLSFHLVQRPTRRPGASSLLKIWFEELRAAARRSPAKPERSRRDGVCRASPRRVQALFQVRPIDRDRTDMQVDLGTGSSPEGAGWREGAGQGAAPGADATSTLTSDNSA